MLSTTKNHKRSEGFGKVNQANHVKWMQVTELIYMHLQTSGMFNSLNCQKAILDFIVNIPGWSHYQDPPIPLQCTNKTCIYYQIIAIYCKFDANNIWGRLK